MSIGVRLRREAEQDIEDAARWYEERSAGLGERFLDEVSGGFDAIADHPAAYPVVHRNVRRALIRTFPFGIYYRVEEGFVLIVAVMHASRSPRRWKERT